ncbi:unnamed protein product, partial [Ectocarpus sp. 8 AP-2014]
RFVKKGDSPAFAAAGANHSILRTSEGKLFRWGVEDGDVHPFPTGVCTQIPLPCIEVCCGRKHTVALMKGGFVMSWGTGYFGQLGHGDNASYRHPRLLRRLDPQRLGERVVQVACGGYHSAVATDAGRVFTWGFNRYGQCGNGSKDNTVPEPSLVDLSRVTPGALGEVPKVLCGRHHSALVTRGGALYTWGACSFGKLGLQDAEKTVCIPQEVTFFSDKPLVQAAAGDFHMVALSRKREVFSWGYGAEGQGGHGSLLHMRMPRRVSSLQEVPVAQVVCGPWWSMAVTVDGYCYAWGSADGGWTGLKRPPGLRVVDPGPSTDRAVETQSFDSTHNVHLPALVYSLAPYKVLQVGCGGGHTLVVAKRRARPVSPGTNGEPGAVPTEVAGGGGGGGGGDGGGAKAACPESSPLISSLSPRVPSSSSSKRAAAAAAATAAGGAGSSSAARNLSLSSVKHARQQAQAAQAAAAAAAAGVADSARRRRAPTGPDLTASTSESGWESGAVDEVATAAAVAASVASAAFAATGGGKWASTSGMAAAPSKQRVQQQGRRASIGGGGAGERVDAARVRSRANSVPVPGGAAATAAAAAAAVVGVVIPPSPESLREETLLPPQKVSRRRRTGSSSSPPGGGGVDGGGKVVSKGISSSGNGRALNGGGGGVVPGADGRRASPIHGVALPAVPAAKSDGLRSAAAGHDEPPPEVTPGGRAGGRRFLSLPGGRASRSSSRTRDGGGGRRRDESAGRRRGGVEGQVGGEKTVAVAVGGTRGSGRGSSGRQGQGAAGGGGSAVRCEEEYVAKVFSYCRHGRLAEVQEALRSGFDVCRRRDENGNTLLHCAAQNGLRGMCKSVLQEGRGQPLNVKNNRGNTALHYAFAFGFQQLGKYLASKGADDTLLNDQG